MNHARILVATASLVDVPAAATTEPPTIEQTAQGARPALGPLASFDGLGVGMIAGPGTNSPPAPRNRSDNPLAIGPNHIVQIVSSRLAVFTRRTLPRTLHSLSDRASIRSAGPARRKVFLCGFRGFCV